MDTTFLQARITATQDQIVAVEAAIDQLVSDNIFQYTINTGQGSQTVTKTDLPRLNKMLDSLYNRVAVLEARLTGSSVGSMRPLF